MEVNKYTPEALTRLPREELRRMLTEELRKDTQQIDDTFIRLLLAELQARGVNSAFVDDNAVEAACEEFRAVTNKKQNSKKSWYQNWMLKVASVVLVLGILFFALPTAAEAKNIPEVLTWWSDSLFQFFHPGSRPNTEEYVFKTDHPGLQEIHDKVTAIGITIPIVPSQLSDEFKLEEFQVFQLEEDISLFTRLVSDRNEILFTAITYSEQAMLQYEKTPDIVSIWNIAGIDHYVISNNDVLAITWVVDNIECSILTDCPEEDVYRLIESIYTSED